MSAPSSYHLYGRVVQVTNCVTQQEVSRVVAPELDGDDQGDGSNEDEHDKHSQPPVSVGMAGHVGEDLPRPCNVVVHSIELQQKHKARAIDRDSVILAGCGTGRVDRGAVGTA